MKLKLAIFYSPGEFEKDENGNALGGTQIAVTETDEDGNLLWVPPRNQEQAKAAEWIDNERKDSGGGIKVGGSYRYEVIE